MNLLANNNGCICVNMWMYICMSILHGSLSLVNGNVNIATSNHHNVLYSTLRTMAFTIFSNVSIMSRNQTKHRIKRIEKKKNHHHHWFGCVWEAHGKHATMTRISYKFFLLLRSQQKWKRAKHLATAQWTCQCQYVFLMLSVISIRMRCVFVFYFPLFRFFFTTCMVMVLHCIYVCVLYVPFCALCLW